MDEVYISRQNKLYVIDGMTGAGYTLNMDTPNAVAMASTNGSGFEVLGNAEFPAQQDLYKFTTTQFPPKRLFVLNPASSWGGTEAMAALAGYVYIVSQGTLWRVIASDGASIVPFSSYPDGWAGTEAMAAVGDSVYVVQLGTLWRVSVTNGSVAPFSAYSTGWAGTEAMAATSDSVYVVQQGTLWRIKLNDGSVAPFSAYPNGWAGTDAMTARNGFLYAVQAGALWRVNTSNGSVVQLGTLPWDGTTAMAARL